MWLINCAQSECLHIHSLLATRTTWRMRNLFWRLKQLLERAKSRQKGQDKCSTGSNNIGNLMPHWKMLGKKICCPPSLHIYLPLWFSFASVDSKKRKLYSGPKAKAKSIYKTYRLSLLNQRRDVRLYILFSGKVFPSIVRFVFIVTAG